MYLFNDNKIKLISFLVLTSLWSPLAQATWGFEAQGIYLSDIQDTASKTQSTKMFFQGALLVDVTKKFYVGWSYSTLSLDQEFATSKNRLEAQDTGLMARYFFGNRNSAPFSVYAVFNVLAKAQQANGTIEEDLSGTSYLVGVSYLPQVSESFRVGVQLSYYNADYTKKTVNGTESSTSYNKNWIFPSAVLFKTF